MILAFSRTLLQWLQAVLYAVLLHCSVIEMVVVVIVRSQQRLASWPLMIHFMRDRTLLAIKNPLRNEEDCTGLPGIVDSCKGIDWIYPLSDRNIRPDLTSQRWSSTYNGAGDGKLVVYFCFERNGGIVSDTYLPAKKKRCAKRRNFLLTLLLLHFPFNFSRFKKAVVRS